MKRTRITARVSQATKELLDQHVRATGVKKGHLVEAALLHHVHALRMLPGDVVVHPRIVVSLRSAEEVGRALAGGRPTRGLRELMNKMERRAP